MATLQALYDEIADDVRTASSQSASDIANQITNRVADAVTFYEGGDEAFWFLQQVATLPTVVGQELYDLPSDIQIANHRMLLADSSITEPLERRDNRWLDARYLDSTQGRPLYWAILQDQLRVRPLPDDVYTLSLTYYKSLGVPSDVNTSNDWTSTAKELIRARAEWSIYQFVMKDSGMAAACKGAEGEALVNLRRRSMKMKTTGRLVATSDSPMQRDSWSITNG